MQFIKILKKKLPFIFDWINVHSIKLLRDVEHWRTFMCSITQFKNVELCISTWLKSHDKNLQLENVLFEKLEPLKLIFLKVQFSKLHDTISEFWNDKLENILSEIWELSKSLFARIVFSKVHFSNTQFFKDIESNTISSKTCSCNSKYVYITSASNSNKLLKS